MIVMEVVAVALVAMVLVLLILLVVMCESGGVGGGFYHQHKRRRREKVRVHRAIGCAGGVLPRAEAAGAIAEGGELRGVAGAAGQDGGPLLGQQRHRGDHSLPL